MKFTKTTRISRCFFLLCHPCRNSGRADGFTRSAVGPASARRRPGTLNRMQVPKYISTVFEFSKIVNFQSKTNIRL